MLFRREDRRELAQLGLIVLGMGVVFAPLLHNVVEHGMVGSSHEHVHVHASLPLHEDDHSHSHPHEHSGPTHRHGDHDLTHLGAVALSHAPVLHPPTFSGIAEQPSLATPIWAPRAREWSRAQPQGP